MNSNPIFAWLRDPRFVPAGAGASSGAGDCNLFLPVEIIGSATEPEPASDFKAYGPEGDPVLVQRVDIALSDLRRVVVEGPMALSSVLGLVLSTEFELEIEKERPCRH